MLGNIIDSMKTNFKYWYKRYVLSFNIHMVYPWENVVFRMYFLNILLNKITLDSIIIHSRLIFCDSLHHMLIR